MSNAPSVTLLLGRFVAWRRWVSWLAVASAVGLMLVLVVSRWWETHPIFAIALMAVQIGLSVGMVRSWDVLPSYLRFEASQGVADWQWRQASGGAWQSVQDVRVVFDAQRWVWVQCVTVDGRHRLHCLSQRDAGPQLWHIWRSVLMTGAS